MPARVVVDGVQFHVGAASKSVVHSSTAAKNAAAMNAAAKPRSRRRRLIDAVSGAEYGEALRLLDEGVNPNTRAKSAMPSVVAEDPFSTLRRSVGAYLTPRPTAQP